MVGPVYDYVITATAVDKVTLSGSNHMDLDVIVRGSTRKLKHFSVYVPY